MILVLGSEEIILKTKHCVGENEEDQRGSTTNTIFVILGYFPFSNYLLPPSPTNDKL